jgi:GNAT superfamily N-acetyltransferase
VRPFVLLPSEHGTGLGQRLLDAALGDAPASLWMTKDSPRALAFSRRNGSDLDGGEKVGERWENPEEARLIR